MEVQFLSKDNKLFYCNDDFLRVTIGKRCWQWNIVDIGAGEIRGGVAVFVDNSGQAIADIQFKPDQADRVQRVVNKINAQGKSIIVPDVFFQNVRRFKEQQMLKFILIAVAIIWLITFTRSQIERSTIDAWANHIYYGTVEYKANVVRVLTHVEDAADALNYIRLTTEKIQATDFYNKYPDLVISVAICTVEGELIQAYDGSVIEFQNVNLDEVENIDDFLYQLSALQLIN